MDNLLNFYHNLPSYVSPEIFSLGGFSLRWYSLSYIVAIILGMIITKNLIRKKKYNFNVKVSDIDDFIVYLIIGIFLGGRIFYVIFYNFSYFSNNPLEILLPFRFTADGFQFIGISGLSFHGGFIGGASAMYFFSKKKKLPFLKFTDLCALVIPVGLTLGRLGNFMNGELYGRVTESSLGMYFLDYNAIPFEELRHPSQLYESLGEGILLFAILWILKDKKFPQGYVTAFFTIGYGVIRFIVEFFRQPDTIFQSPGNSLGTVLLGFSMGQVLCFVMVVFGFYLIFTIKDKSPTFN